ASPIAGEADATDDWLLPGRKRHRDLRLLRVHRGEVLSELPTLRPARFVPERSLSSLRLAALLPEQSQPLDDVPACTGLALANSPRASRERVAPRHTYQPFHHSADPARGPR